MRVPGHADFFAFLIDCRTVNQRAMVAAESDGLEILVEINGIVIAEGYHVGFNSALHEVKSGEFIICYGTSSTALTCSLLETGKWVKG